MEVERGMVVHTDFHRQLVHASVLKGDNILIPQTALMTKSRGHSAIE
jgi:hypothetical protein